MPEQFARYREAFEAVDVRQTNGNLASRMVVVPSGYLFPIDKDEVIVSRRRCK